MFSYLEYCITRDARPACALLKDRVKKSLDVLVGLGSDKLLLEDFMEEFVAVVNGVVDGGSSVDDVLTSFRDAMVSNGIIFYARMMASAHIQVILAC